MSIPKTGKHGSRKSSSSSRDVLNRRVSAVLDLLHAAGSDTIDSSQLEKEAKRFTNLIEDDDRHLPLEPQAWDHKVDRLVGQLRDALQDDPETEARRLLQSVDTSGRSSRAEPEPRPEPQAKPEPAPSPAPATEESEADPEDCYPMIGPDHCDISVVSELTTPTVVTRQAPDEEKYDLPPAGTPMHIGMQIGFGSKKKEKKSKPAPAAPKAPAGKSRNRLQQAQYLRPPSRRVVTNRPETGRGAAAHRRTAHQLQMQHIEKSLGATAIAEQKKVPTKLAPSSKDRGRKGRFSANIPSQERSASSRMLLSRTKSQRASTQPTKYEKKTRRASTANIPSPSKFSMDRSSGTPTTASASSGSDGWPTSLDMPAAKKKEDPLLIDEDGFLITPGGGSNPFGSDPFAFDSGPSMNTSSGSRRTRNRKKN